MGTRRQARECALQILFQIEFASQKLKEMVDVFWSQQDVGPEEREFAQQLVEGTLRNQAEIDVVIEGSSTNWKLSRMAGVDPNLLRQSTYEILYVEEIPHSVTINEAVDIAKKFGSDESASFINGVLDKIAQDRAKK